MSNVRIVEAPTDQVPVCPYCKKELEEIWCKSEGLGFSGKDNLLMCPYCKALLAYGAWRR
jgi:uncharacterized Zn-finger protein